MLSEKLQPFVCSFVYNKTYIAKTIVVGKGLERQLRAPGVVLDQILVGGVPLRLQKHTRSLCQAFEKVNPTVYQFFEKLFQTLYLIPKS